MTRARLTPEEEIDHVTPEDIIMQRESTDAISLGLESLSEREREILLETVFSDAPITHLEMGEKLGKCRSWIGLLREGALQKLWRRCRAKIL